jgi:hypothetical protein
MGGLERMKQRHDITMNLESKYCVQRLEEGDVVERKYANEIRGLIGNYEIIWGTFIGCRVLNKKATPLAIKTKKSLGDVQKQLLDNQRSIFSSSHYTLVHSLLHLESLSKNYVKEFIAADEVDYLELDCVLTSFFAHVGRSYDMINKMGYCLDEIERLLLGKGKIKKGSGETVCQDSNANKRHSLSETLSDFWNRRITLIHGPRAVLRVKDGLLWIPTIESEIPHNYSWDQSQSEKTEWVGVDEVFKEMTSDFLTKCNEIESKVMSRILNWRKQDLFELEPFESSSSPTKITSDRYELPLSGSCGPLDRGKG